MDNKNSSNGFFNGFFLGLLAGVVITLLFSTKKGRNLVRNLVDGSEESLKELEEFFEDKTEEYIPRHISDIEVPQPMHREPVRPSVPLQFHPYPNEGLKNGYTTHVHVVSETTPPAQVKRFFRGIPKK